MSEPVRRLELFTGQGRRRAWSDEEKAAILAESWSIEHRIRSDIGRRVLARDVLTGCEPYSKLVSVRQPTGS